jgi:multidrug resistance protein MdtO
MKPVDNLWQFLKVELAPRPGRLGNSLRITALTVLVVIISETYQIPLTAYSAYIVFFSSKEESASTILTGVVVTLAITLSVFSALGIYMISSGEPGLRLPLMCAIVFTGMFISRASPLGPVGFIIGFLVTVSLTLIDVTPTTASSPSADLLTRSVLWLWVMAMVPVVILIAGNAIAGRDPMDLFREGVIERLSLAGRVLSGAQTSTGDRDKILEYSNSGTGGLLKLLKVAGIFNSKIKKDQVAQRALVTGLAQLNMLLSEWSELNAIIIPQGGNVGRGIDRQAGLLLEKIVKLTQTLGLSHEPPQPSEKKAVHGFLAPDAFTNPDYFRYALKTTLAIFIAYITYNMLDWPGIRTCMITCFFVSLGSFGESAQKMTLRLAGSLIGGGLGLATVIFVMPHMTTITGLSLIIAVVGFFAAWVATSSERLSYAGLQIAMGYLFSTLVGWGPSVALDESRDRVVGVIFGNLIISAVFSLLWPVSAATRARDSIISALEKLSFFLSGQEDVEGFFGSFDEAIVRARRLTSLDPFEPKIVRGGSGVMIDSRLDMRIIDAVQALAGPVMILAAPDPVLSRSMATYNRSLGAWILQTSERLAGKATALPPPNVGALVQEIPLATGVRYLAYVEWLRALDLRVHELDALIKTPVREGIQLSSTSTRREAA